MITKRIIPCLDVRDGRVVKGVNFVNLRDAGDPVEIAEYYNTQGADEIVFLDITASHEKRKTIVDIVTGIIVILFGLNFLGVFKLNIFKGSKKAKTENLGFFSSMIFGIVFSIGWTPCVGAFLGSALMMAASQGQATEGIIMLLLYSLGLGIPFFISAILIDKLRGAFTFIKKHYKVINTVCGCLLVVVGILMATGLFGKFISWLS